MARRNYASLKAAAAALTEFDKTRHKAQVAAVKVIGKAIALEGRRRARAIKLVKDATKRNPHIKVMVKSSTRWSTSGNQVVGKVQATGLAAKIEMGLKARRFWLRRSGAATFRFKGLGGRWTTVGDVRAGGETFKKRTIIEMTSAHSSKLRADVDALMQTHANEAVG